MNTSFHFANERSYRETLVNYLGGPGKVILTNTIDRGHKDGPERFELTDKAILYVYNARTNRHINILFPRVGQLYSRFGNLFDALPAETQKAIKSLCREYERLGYNEI